MIHGKSLAQSYLENKNPKIKVHYILRNITIVFSKNYPIQRKIVKKSYILLLLLLTLELSAQKITIFAASDLKFALDSIKEEFVKKHPSANLNMIYGSSGKGMHQIENGAPYDIFFSANMAFVEKLYAQGDIVTPPKLYATGRIVLWSKHKEFDTTKGFENLKAPWVKKIAIANPSHAPYGEKAKQALESLKLYETLQKRLVLGENISQTAGFIASGSAEIGVIALALVLAPTIANSKNSNYYLIDDALHEPLLQGYGITKVGADKSLTQTFYDFLETKEANAILEHYGFIAKRGVKK